MVIKFLSKLLKKRAGIASGFMPREKIIKISDKTTKYL